MSTGMPCSGPTGMTFGCVMPESLRTVRNLKRCGGAEQR